MAAKKKAKKKPKSAAKYLGGISGKGVKGRKKALTRSQREMKKLGL